MVISLLQNKALFAQLPYFDNPGFNPHREYFNQAFNERIDPFTGGVMLTYTDIFLPGNGGLDLKILRVYNSKIFVSFAPTSGKLISDSWVGLGWSLHMGRAFFPQGGGLPTIEMPDGSMHRMYNSHDNTPTHVSTDNWIGSYVADGSKIYYQLRLTDGTIYTFDNPCVDLDGARMCPVTEIKDPNGNTIRIEYEVAYWTLFMKRITDSAGRIVIFNYNTSDENKELKSIEVNSHIWQYFYEDIPEIGYSLLTEVKPPVGASWKYSYNKSVFPKYELTEVTYPTGGKIQYTYGTEDLAISGWRQSYRVVKTRTATGRDIVPGTWKYDYQFGTSKTGITTVTDPAGRSTKHYFYGAGYTPETESMWRVGIMTKKEISEGGSIVEEVTYDWDNSLFVSYDWMWHSPFVGHDSKIYLPTLKSVTVKRGPSQYSTTYSNYDMYGNPQTISEQGERSKTISRTYDHRLAFVSQNIIALVQSETVSGLEGSFETKYEYDDNANAKSIDKYGIKTNYTYYSNGNLQSEQDANGQSKSYSNYRYGVAEIITNSEYAIHKKMNFEGTTAWQQDGRGNTTTFSYDMLNRLTSIDFPGSEAIVNIEYASDGSSTKVTQSDSWTIYTYDGFGRPTGTQNIEGIKTQTTYNNNGEKDFQSYAFSINEVGDRLSYDVLGRIIQLIHSDGTSITYTYSGNSVAAKNERNLLTTYVYESFGSVDKKVLAKVVDPITTTTYDYNVLGSLTKIDHGGGFSRTFGYDSRNFLQLQEQPEGGKTSYTRDGVGNIKSKTDANGNTISYSYDGINRLKKIDYSTGVDIEFQYDGADNLIRMTDASGDYSYQYSPTNRLTSKSYTIDRQPYIISYNYDLKGDMAKITYPSGKFFEYPRDAAHRIKSVSSIVTAFEYHPSGHPQKITFSSGVTTTLGYDPNRYWTKSIKTGPGVLDLLYEYDAAGNTKRIINGFAPGLTKTLEYDNLDRLIEANGSWGSGRFTYDALGNRLSKTIGPTSTTYSYNPQKRLITSRSVDSTEVFTFDFDSNGNTTKNGKNTFEYNFENQIRAVDNGTTAQYIYDGQKRRVKKISRDGKITIYHYDQDDNVIAETDAQGKVLTEFVYANGQILAMIKPGNVTSVDSPPEIVSLTVDGMKLEGVATSRPLIEATIQARSRKGIALNGISLVLDQVNVGLDHSNFDAQTGHLSYRPEKSLKQGQHSIELRVTDKAGNGPAAKVLAFAVEGLRIRDVLNYPNPFQRETKFTYVLTDYADEVEIRIYTIAGRLIKVIKNAPATPNFNWILWDGLDQDGDFLANGVYLYKITAKQADITDEKIEKLAIAR